MFNVKLASMPAVVPALGHEMEGTIKLPQLRRLISAGIVSHVDVVGRTGGWTIRAYTGERHPPMLATAAGAVRVFTTSDSAIYQLIRLGLTRFEVVADEYESGTLRAPRPDRAEAMKRQAEYDAWFNAKLEAVHTRIDSGTEVSHTPEDAWARVQERIASYEKGGRKD